MQMSELEVGLCLYQKTVFKCFVVNVHCPVMQKLVQGDSDFLL